MNAVVHDMTCFFMSCFCRSASCLKGLSTLYLYCSTYWSFIPLCDRITSRWMDATLFHLSVHRLTNVWVVSAFWLS